MGETQAEAILRAWQESGRTVLAGPECDERGQPIGWYARIVDGPTFSGADLIDALAQLATWLLAVLP
jgi:hypothetical protein